MVAAGPSGWGISDFSSIFFISIHLYRSMVGELTNHALRPSQVRTTSEAVGPDWLVVYSTGCAGMLQEPKLVQ